MASLPASFTAASGSAKLYSLAIVTLAQDEELAAQGIQVLKEDVLDKTVQLNIEYKSGREAVY